MFCSNCGAKAFEGDQFCPQCGSKLKYAAQQSAQTDTTAQQAQYRPAEPASSSAANSQPYVGNPFAQKNERASGAKKFRSLGTIIALLIVVVAAMLLFMGARGYVGDDMGDILSSCGSCGEQTEPVEVGGAPASESDILPVISDADITTAVQPPTTTTTTTTEAPTTTTTVDAKKLEAEEIRELLVSRKWETELEGYKATVTFKKDGTAAITVKILFISKTIEAKYSVNDKCHAVIQANYEGQTRGISGQISKVSDTKLVVDRDKNMGKVYLTAA